MPRGYRRTGDNLDSKRSDIRFGCRFDPSSGGISTNRFVALVGASETMNDYELTSFDSESLDGRVVVAPDTITCGTETYSVADAEPYLAHFTHNHKEIITDTDYKAETGASSQVGSLVLYGAIQKYSVTYTDGIGGASFADEVTSDLRRGTPTPAFTGGTPQRLYLYRLVSGSGRNGDSQCGLHRPVGA